MKPVKLVDIRMLHDVTFMMLDVKVFFKFNTKDFNDCGLIINTPQTKLLESYWIDLGHMTP